MIPILAAKAPHPVPLPANAGRGSPHCAPLAPHGGEGRGEGALAGVMAFALLALVFLLLAFPAQAFQVQRVVSPRGVEAWLVEDHTNPIIAMRIAFRGGSALDPEGKDGLADMASSLLDEGAGDLDSQAFQERLKTLGVDLGFDMGLDTFGSSLRTLTEHSDQAFELLRLALTAPRFDGEAVERIRSALLANLRRSNERPGTMAYHRMQETFFAGHPYSRRSDGAPESLAAITADDLKAFVARRLGRDNLIVSVTGDVTADRLKGLLDKTFGALPEHAAPWDLPNVAPKTTGTTIVLEDQIPQSVMLFGHQGPKRNDPDFYAVTVLNHILGGGTFTSRLFNEVREKRGLAYSVDTYLYPMEDSGLLLGNAGTANARAGETIEVVRDVWRRTAGEAVTPQEVEDAKTYLIGSYALRFDSSARIAGVLTAIQFDRLGLDYLDKRNSLIAAVTPDDVNRVARKWLHPGELTFFVVGQPNLSPKAPPGTPLVPPAQQGVPPH